MTSLDVLLGKAFHLDRLGHATLLVGEGVQAVASHLLIWLLCRERGCRRCVACQKVIHGTHPDVRWIEKEGARISIDRIRELQQDARYRPLEASRKVYLISGAEELSLEGANSLLRILEAPPPYVLFLLLARSLGLPPTILSRCQIVRLRPPSAEQLVEALLERGHDPDEVDYLLALVRGSPARRVQVLDEGETTSQPLWHRDETRAKLRELEDAELVAFLGRAEGLIEQREGALELLRRLKDRGSHQVLELARSMSRWPPGALEAFSEEALRWHRDLLLVVEDGGEALVFSQDQLEELRAQARAVRDGGRVRRAIGALQTVRQALRGNANVQLTLESLLFTLSG